MEAKHGYLTSAQVSRLEHMALRGKEAHVRDAFLFCCWTGLRFSDFATLRPEHIQDGWISKKMVKTGYLVEVPLDKLFDGRAHKMIDRYGGVERLTRNIGKNSDVNAVLHDVIALLEENVKPVFKVTFHTSRHTFATLLLQQGMPMTTIQQLLGHRKIETTAIYGERDRNTLEAQLKNNTIEANNS